MSFAPFNIYSASFCGIFRWVFVTRRILTRYTSHYYSSIDTKEWSLFRFPRYIACETSQYTVFPNQDFAGPHVPRFES